MDLLPTGTLIFLDNAMNSEGLTVSAVALQTDSNYNSKFLDCRRIELSLPPEKMTIGQVSSRRLMGFLCGYKSMIDSFKDKPAAVICSDSFIALGCKQLLSGKRLGAMNPRYAKEWEAISKVIDHSHLFLSRSAKACPILARVKRYAELKDESMISVIENEPRRFFCGPVASAYAKDALRLEKAKNDYESLFSNS